MGKYITDIEQVYESMKMMVESIKGLPELKEKLLNSKLCIGYEIIDPDGRVYIDFSGADIELYLRECPPQVTPSATMKLTADILHLYWLGKVNFMIASFKGDIKVTGNLLGLTKLVPLSNQLFKVYTDNLKKAGMGALIPA